MFISARVSPVRTNLTAYSDLAYIDIPARDDYVSQVMPTPGSTRSRDLRPPRWKKALPWLLALPALAVALGAGEWSRPPNRRATQERPSPSGALAGSRACAGCHASVYTAWLATPHAQEEIALGCEGCHGPGASHRRQPTSRNIQREPGVSRCLSCHAPESSPGFQRDYRRHKREVHPSGRSLETRWREIFAAAIEAGRPVEMELFVMMDCPYGIEAERRIIPLALAFPERIRLRVTFMPEADLPAATGEERLSPDCLPDAAPALPHEAQEPREGEFLEEQLRQVLIREYMPERFLDYVLNRLAFPPQAPWSEVAESAGLEPAMLREWLRSGEGLALLQQDGERYRQRGIYASPTLLVEGREYPGALTSAALLRQWCAAAGPEHPFCRSLPKCYSDADCDAPREYCADLGTPSARCAERPVVPVTLTILDSLKCRSCFSDLVIGSVKQLFVEPTICWLDVDSRQGRQWAEHNGLERIPAYFFSPSIEASTPVFEDLKPILRETAEGYLLDPGLLEAPLLWQRERLPGRLELWFHPGQPGSDAAEAWWAERLPSATQPLEAEAHYVIEDPTAFLQPHFSLEALPGSDTLVLSPRLSEEQLDLLHRYALWRLAPATLARYLQEGKRLPEDFQPPEGWETTLRTVAPDALRDDIRLCLRRPFIEAGGGALVHNQLWIARWNAGTIPRIFYELHEPLSR